MLRVGLPGGIACGKTVVRRRLEERGIPTLDADAVVHRLLEPGTDVTREIAEAFGEEVIASDGSVDRKALGAIVFREDVRGYGRAYKKGFGMATGDVIVTLDGDHSYPPDAISYLLEAFLHLEVDFLNASRFPVQDPEAMSMKHRIGNLILSVAMSILFFRWIHDSQSGMWVFRRSILRDMILESDSMAFSEEIKIEALLHPTAKFREISISAGTPSPFSCRDRTRSALWRTCWLSLSSRAIVPNV